MKRYYKILLVVLIASIIISQLVSCKNRMNDSSLSEFSGDTLKTLQSLQQIDDYPLYVMTYYGDYGFDRLLKSDDSSAPGTDEDNSEQNENFRCTCFSAFGNGEHPIFGRNFDWYHRASLVLFTDPPAGYASVSMVDIFYLGYAQNADLTTLSSRQALLAAPFLPFDGMNEKGVAIGIMAVPYVQLPYDPVKKSLEDLQVVRLVLDYAGSVEHAILLIQNYNIRMDEVPLHYLIADRSGKSAIIEFVNNKIEVFYNTESFQVCTNFIVTNASPPLTGNCWRYDRAYSTLTNKTGAISISEAKAILRDVSQSNTMWSTIYDMKSGEMQIVPGRKYTTEHKLQLEMSE